MLFGYLRDMLRYTPARTPGRNVEGDDSERSERHARQAPPPETLESLDATLRRLRGTLSFRRKLIRGLSGSCGKVIEAVERSIQPELWVFRSILDMYHAGALYREDGLKIATPPFRRRHMSESGRCL
jgi:hypothetical protein